MRQIYNHAQTLQPNTRVTYTTVPTIGSIAKKLRTILPDKEALIDGLILAPLAIALMIVMLSL